MSDNFQVTAVYDKSAYNAGDTMKITISGDDVLTQTSQVTQPATATLTITAADGATTTLNVASTVTTTTTTTTPESVKITSVTDPSGRVWTVDASGLFATATA